MNRRSIPLKARALTAALTLAALWPLGSSADVARQASSPTSGTDQAAGLPSAPAASAPAAVAFTMPASFQGRWTTDGRGLVSTGPLTLGVRTLRWSICGKAARRIKPQVMDGGQQTDYPAFNASDAPQVTDNGPQVLIDLTAGGAPPCKLDGQPVTYLRLEPGEPLRPRDVCEMQVTFYQNGPQPAQELAWGVFTNEHCYVVQARQFQDELNGSTGRQGAAGQASAASPASGAAKAAGLPSAPAASAPAATVTIPASFQSRWTPDSKALETGGQLTLGERVLYWPACGKATRHIKPQVTDDGQQVLVDLTANGAPPCKLNGQPVTHLRLMQGSPLRPRDVCQMQVTLYGTGPQPAQQKLLSWGVFTDEHCYVVQAQQFQDKLNGNQGPQGASGK